jgi:hypothetical protein
MRSECKIFSLIADCTPDISHVEQLSVTVKYVDVTNGGDDNEICERFLGFTSIETPVVRGSQMLY